MKKVETRGKTVEIPSCIDELTPGQYEYYCFLAFLLSDGMIGVDTWRIRWLSYLLGLKVSYMLLKPEFIAELQSQQHVIDGFFRDDRLDFETARNLLPEYRDYKGPGDLLSGVSFGEFVECYTVAETLGDGSPEAMAAGCEHIARVLYHIPEIDPVPSILAFHAPRLFSSVWHAIHSGPIEINGKKIDFRIIFKSSGLSRPDDKTGWTGITFEVASAGLFGNVDDVERADMWAVLMYLYKCKFEYINDKQNSK